MSCDVKQSVQFNSEVVRIIEHTKIAFNTWRVRLAVPQSMSTAVPGQFFMLRDHRSSDPLIGRAFAMYDSDPVEGWIDLVYLKKGKLTSAIVSLRSGDSLSLWGPLGNSFDTAPCRHLILVAGGIGQTPFLSLTKEASGQRQYGNRPFGYASHITLCYGARSEKYLADLDALRNAGCSLKIATEDGSVGPPQLVTRLLEELLEVTDNSKPDEDDGGQVDYQTDSVRIVTCGPEAMMEAVSRIALNRSINCQVSLETPMACGMGICFSCVARIGADEDWDYKRTCIDGPIFDATQVVW